MIFIGLDTHKEFHEVAYCEEQRGATPVHYGRIPSSKVSSAYSMNKLPTNTSIPTDDITASSGALAQFIMSEKQS